MDDSLMAFGARHVTVTHAADRGRSAVMKVCTWYSGCTSTLHSTLNRRTLAQVSGMHSALKRMIVVVAQTRLFACRSESAPIRDRSGLSNCSCSSWDFQESCTHYDVASLSKSRCPLVLRLPVPAMPRHASLVHPQVQKQMPGEKDW